MTSSHITHQLALSRINEFHRNATAARMATEVAHGRRRGVPTVLLRWLRARRGRARDTQPQTATDAR